MANGWGGRRPGAGRPKGAKGKLDLTLRKRLANEGCDPADVLKELLRHDDDKIQLEAAKALMPYVHPRLSTSDVNLSATSLPDVTISLVMPDADSDGPDPD